MIEIDVHRRPDGVAVVVPKGRLNMVAAWQMKEILALLVSEGSARIVVDLEQTTFLDSSGLGALIGGLKSARQAGGDLRIARPTAEVMTVFQLTNMDKVLRPRDDVDSAFDV
ncbi:MULTISPECIES: STAS domain-containing protein [unclassified Nocardioides]|uniref:STAS domain-containing protein n=1 Tax=unclassified Nocardioides TaxID=2615069 RepID=UPI0009F02C94|nr:MULTISPECIES: STAS domain-containing protein [unclassified Nocardioides]GAW50204.1 anti-anti-sigma factor [Nocardioides sp. PD653-B2]GAW53147.1 anti-anti-sigma factor [Nocardioides sp. PD653]